MSPPAAVDIPVLAPVKPGPFRFRKVAGKMLVTNDLGRHQLLDDAQFRRFVTGALEPGDALYEKLKVDGFIRDQMDFDAIAGVWAQRNKFLWQGPTLHVIVTTLQEGESLRGEGYEGEGVEGKAQMSAPAPVDI